MKFNKLDNLDDLVKDIPNHITDKVVMSMNILDRIHELLEKKFNGKQKLLAEKMGKSEAQISKWLSGIQNYTLDTIIALQIAFGESILVVCSEEEHAEIEFVKPSRFTTCVKLFVEDNGNLKPKKETYVESKGFETATLNALLVE